VFRGLTVRKGNTAGQRFMAVLVEVGDDERPKENPTAVAVGTSEASERVGAEASGLPTAGPKGGPLSQDAAMICATEEFQDFASQIAPGFELSEDGAARCVRSYCGVRSRAELDHNPNAASRFSLLMHKYREWREGQGKA